MSQECAKTCARLCARMCAKHVCQACVKQTCATCVPKVCQRCAKGVPKVCQRCAKERVHTTVGIPTNVWIPTAVGIPTAVRIHTAVAIPTAVRIHTAVGYTHSRGTCHNCDGLLTARGVARSTENQKLSPPSGTYCKRLASTTPFSGLFERFAL